MGFNRLDRRAGQRKAMLKNAQTSLFIHERIKTTKAKALEIRKGVEKIITRAKEDTVHNRRIVAKVITDKAALAKIFTEIAPRYKGRPGGYTRILRLGQRQGDAAEIVILEFVESEAIEEKKQQKRKRREQKAEKARLEEERIAKEQKEAEAEEEAKKTEKVKETKSKESAVEEEVESQRVEKSAEKEDKSSEEE
ncbi:MAG: 50S ribosomal protein L17 [Spirochaetales bacterium]|nr:50S ribosomal protein L17 [Spirochaetales bacterium]